MHSASKVQLLLCCTILAWAIAHTTAADVGPRPALQHGSPSARLAHNRRALRSSTSKNELFSQFEAAAAAGDLHLSRSLQRQLLAISQQQQKHKHRRSLKQVDCEALTRLEGCAEFDCSASNTLEKADDGTVQCIFREPEPEPVVIREFEDVYNLPYDYSSLWDTDADNVLTGASASDQTTVSNNLFSSVGTWGAESKIEDVSTRRTVPNIFLGTKADDTTNLNFFTTETAVSTDALQPATVTTTATSGAETSGTFGAYLPGTIATAREVEDGGSDDNVVLTRDNIPGLFGYWFGRH